MSPPGDIRAYDVLTGKLVWTFHTVPRPGEFGYDTWPKDAYKYIGGVNNWGEMTVDTARGIAFIPLGSPTYDFYGADRIGANLFGTSIVALDARTGKRLWHFQFVHHDLWDLDPSAAPQLTTIRHNGRNRDVVAVTNKTGWLYVFDRVTGEPIWPIEERPVPKSEMPGEQSWPTQPYPTNPPPYVKHTFDVDDISPYLLAGGGRGVQDSACSRPTTRASSRRSARRHGARARRATAARCSAAPRPSRAPAPSTSSRTTTRASSGCCVPARGRGGGGPPCRRGRSSTSRTARRATASDRQGTDTGVPLVHADRRSGEQHRRRRAPVRRGRDSRRDRDRQGPHAAVPASQHRATSTTS